MRKIVNLPSNALQRKYFVNTLQFSRSHLLTSAFLPKVEAIFDQKN